MSDEKERAIRRQQKEIEDRQVEQAPTPIEEYEIEQLGHSSTGRLTRERMELTPPARLKSLAERCEKIAAMAREILKRKG